jgi:hypothetical protein
METTDGQHDDNTLHPPTSDVISACSRLQAYSRKYKLTCVVRPSPVDVARLCCYKSCSYLQSLFSKAVQGIPNLPQLSDAFPIDDVPDMFAEVNVVLGIVQEKPLNVHHAVLPLVMSS